MNLQFQYPWVLFLLWLVPVAGLVWHVLSNRRGAVHALVSPVMAAKLAPTASPVRRLWQLVLLMTGLFLALIAVARPQWGSQEETVYQKGRDLMIVLDVSRSMLANDVHPSRLGRAKADLRDLVKQLRGDRAGLMAFRGKPLLLCPLTTDYGFLAQTLDGADVDSAPAGETDIGNAVMEALKTLEGDEGSHKALVLVSDGDDLAGKTAEAATKAKEAGVAVFAVGFGSAEGASVPSALDKKATMTFQGQAVLSKLNHEVLRDLSEQTGGAYVPVGVANVKLGDLYRNHLSRIRARDLEESVQRRAVERYQWFLFPAVLCLIGLAFFSRGQIALQRSQPPNRRPPALDTARRLSVSVAALGLMPVLACRPALAMDTNAPPGRAGARLAQALYVAGHYEDAARAYQAASRTAASANRDDYLYNAGCAYLKAGKADAAADALRELTGLEGDRGASAAYNLGCALAASGSASLANNASKPPDPDTADRQVQSLKQAGRAFQHALQQKPDFSDSRKNLAVVATLAREAETRAKLIRVMAEHGQTPPGTLADLMLLRQRKLIQGIPLAFTNTTPALIDALEGLASEQDQTADLMIPLKGTLQQAIEAPGSQGASTNALQQAAMIDAFAESIRDTMQGAASALRDLDRAALAPATRAEASVYTLWKGIAGYEQLLREDLERQTNAITRTAANLMNPTEPLRKAVGAQQTEALQLTGLFMERFEQTVPPEGISRPIQQTTTNGAPGTNAMEQVLSPVTRAKIVELAGQARAAQTEAGQAIATNLAASLQSQRKAHDLLREIEKLLPKEKQPQDSQQQPKQQQDQQQQPEPQPRQEQQKPEPQPQKQETPKPDEMSKDDLQKLLEKARQREQDHAQERREHEASFPMSPAERDW